MTVPAGEIASLKIWRSEVEKTTLFLTMLEISGDSPGSLLRGALRVWDQEIGRHVIYGLPHIPRGARLS
jgi:hypothetical protein